MPFLPLSKRPLSAARSVRVRDLRSKQRGKTHAARFCAFLRDCAGVMLSFSSLLLRLVCGMSLSSKARPLSTESFGSIASCCCGGDADVGMGVSPVLWPRGASKA